jgi:hypothetical protein
MSVLAAEVRQKIVGDEGAIMTEASVYVWNCPNKNPYFVK